MYLPKPSEGADYAIPPAGTFPAICYRIIDLGTQTSAWNGQEKQTHKVMLGWELKGDETIMDDGRPMSVHQRYTWSMHEKATLRRQLEAWLGRKLTDADFGPGGFDIRSLLGMGCLVNIMHEERNDRVYANVASVAKLPKGMSAGSLINETVWLWLSAEGFNPEVFASLSDGLKATIAKSPEYRQLAGTKPVAALRKPAAGANAYREQSQTYSRPEPPDDDYERWGPPHGEAA